MMSAMSASLSALGAFGVGMQVTADNIANVNTPFFKSSRVDYAAMEGLHGVRLGEISRDLSPGPPIPALPVQLAPRQALSWRQASNVSVEREFTQLVGLENAYMANAVAVRVMDDMSGALVDMVV